MNAIKTLTLFILPLSGLAADLAPTQRSVEVALEQLGVDAAPSELLAAPIPGFLEIHRGMQVLYLSTDGSLLINGDILSLATESNLTEISRASSRRDLIAAVPRKLRIIVPAEGPTRRHVVIFVDADCPYCRALHDRRADFAQHGLEVHFLFFPRSGPSGASYSQAIAVWCAADQRAALDSVLHGADLPATECENPIDQHYALAQALELKGTPAVITADGGLRYGVVDVDELLR